MGAYLFFLATFLYFIGFVGDFLVPKTVDSGEPASVGVALAVNLALIALFGVQHSVMARAAFKRRWRRIVAEPVARSTYVLVATAVLALVMGLWQPMPTQVWLVENPIGY